MQQIRDGHVRTFTGLGAAFTLMEESRKSSAALKRANRASIEAMEKWGAVNIESLFRHPIVDTYIATPKYQEVLAV